MNKRKPVFHKYVIKFIDRYGNVIENEITECLNIKEAKQEAEMYIKCNCSGIKTAKITRIYKKENEIYV